MPGFLRVDTVHQGDRDGVKGVHIVNLVDEVTQYEYVGVVRGISERFLIPALEALLLMFPFPVLGFHADNGSEYINHRMVGLLQKLRVGEFTKSRARRSNDNAPVEGKNASRGAQASRPRASPGPLRGRRGRLRARTSVAVRELPPPVHHRFHVQGDRVRGQAVENAISLVVHLRRRCSTPQSPKHHLAASRPPRRIEPQPPPRQTRP